MPSNRINDGRRPIASEGARDDRRVTSRLALSRQVEARHLQGRKQQREADALAQRTQNCHDDHADQMPARDLHQHREVTAQLLRAGAFGVLGHRA